MKKPKIRELKEALKVLFVEGPYTAKFPAEIPTFDRYRGKPEYDEKRCIGCGACAEVCPAGAIDVVDDLESKKRTLIVHTDKCIFCGQCHAYCTTKDGINQTHEYDLATLHREEAIETVEKDLVLCEVCGKVIGTDEHLCWIADRLGAFAYTNPTLFLTSLKRLGMIDFGGARPKDMPSTRADLFRVLCPQCRRDQILREEWQST
jgi:hydrogenase-4 component H